MTSSKDQMGNTLQLKKIEYCNTFNGTFFYTDWASANTNSTWLSALSS